MSKADVAQETAPPTQTGSLYFAYTGCVVGAVIVVTFFGGLSKHSWDALLTRVVLVSFGMTAFYAGVALAQKLRWFAWLSIALKHGEIDGALPDEGIARLYEWFVWLASATFVVAALIVLFDTHRRYIGIIGLLEACAIYSLRPPMTPLELMTLAVLSVATWALAAGLTYTNFGDWMLNSNASPLAVLAFVVSFSLVLIELSDDEIQPKARSVPRYVLWAVLIVFVAFAFRSDQLLNTWIPYHRSFFADVAQLVREGHWLLWDVPSLYGFISIAVIAAIPAKDAWQGLFVLTSIALVVQSCIISLLWRWGRTGWTNLFFALLLTLSIFGDSIGRYPWSARLYPQGALRFIWILGLLATAFLIYAWREKTRRVEALYWFGHAIWVISVFWSFETAVWDTVVWVPYLTLSTLIHGLNHGLAKRLALRLWPVIVLPLAALGVIQLIYLRGIGRGPDWFGFVEFTGLFVSGTVHAAFPINPFGAGWCIVLVLGAIGSVAIASIRQGLWAPVPLLVATWLAVWSTSTYFSVEPFDGHVALLLPVLMSAAAVATFVSREILRGNRAALYARLSIAPIAIISISQFLSRPEAIAGMTFPLQPGWTTDTAATLPPISGELARLIARAGIQPGAPLLIPNRPYWTEISQGMLFPIAYSATAGNIAYQSWVPISPLGIEDTIMGLSANRRQTYIERFLERSRKGGWYIQYRAPASCEILSTHLATAKTLRSTNYSASFCVFK